MRNQDLCHLLQKQPNAHAKIIGSEEYSEIVGNTSFYQTLYGVIVVTCVVGLPTENGNCNNRIFAIHIHQGSECSGNQQDPFLNTGMHYSPNECNHPYHAGDMPPLFGTKGYAFSCYLTNYVTVEEIVGKTVVIHENLDDFTTQPSGNAGKKIACGIIVK